MAVPGRAHRLDISLAPLTSQQASVSLALDDRDLIARIRAGDIAAFEALFRAYHAEMWTFAEGYVRSSEIAEDLVHDVFAALWEQRASWIVHDTGQIQSVVATPPSECDCRN